MHGQFTLHSECDCLVSPRRAHGVTLIELVITVAILALLATVAVPMTELTVQREGAGIEERTA